MAVAVVSAFIAFHIQSELFRRYVSPFGYICVSNEEAKSETRFDIVFVGGRSDAEELTNAFGRVAEKGVLVWRLDVKDMPTEEFKRRVESFPCPSAHLWMPSADEWTIVGRRAPDPQRLEAMMDVFTRDSAFETLAEAQTTALSDVFASYAGDVSGIADAFKQGDLAAVVRPEFFVTKDIPAIDWVVKGEIDDDIYRTTLAEIRSMQVVRRLIIEGDLVAAEGKADDATEVWARAFLRNPRDPMLLDRLDRLFRNGAALLSVGNVPAAAKCYETIIVINPKNSSAVLKYGKCLRRLGKKDAADQVLARAKELLRR